MDCVGFVYNRVEITAASSNNGGGRVLGLLCMGRNGAGSNLAVHFNFFSFFSPVKFFPSVDSLHLRRNSTTCMQYASSADLNILCKAKKSN